MMKQYCYQNLNQIANSVEVLTFKVLIDSNISHNEFVFINNVLKNIYDIKDEIQNSNNK